MAKPGNGWRIIVADTAIFGLLFGATNVVSYAYIVVAGRALSPADFGVFNALLGILTIAGVFAASLQPAVARTIAGRATRATQARLMQATFTRSAPVVGFLTLAFVPLATNIGANTAHVATCAAAVLLTILATTASGFLLGIGKVRTQAAIGLLGAVARLGAGWLLMALGFGASGALFGYVTSFLVVLAISYYLSMRSANGPLPLREQREVSELRIDFSAMFTLLLAFAPFCVDQLFVQALNPSIGGNYAAISTIGKIIFFATYPLTAVAYSHMLRQSSARAYARTLMVYAIVMTCSAFGLALVASVFSGNLVSLFFGPRFPESAAHVGLMSFGAACFSLSILASHVLISLGARLGYVSSLFSLAIGAVLFAARHDSLAALVQNQVSIYAIQLLLVPPLLIYSFRRVPDGH